MFNLHHNTKSQQSLRGKTPNAPEGSAIYPEHRRVNEWPKKLALEIRGGGGGLVLLIYDIQYMLEKSKYQGFLRNIFYLVILLILFYYFIYIYYFFNCFNLFVISFYFIFIFKINSSLLLFIYIYYLNS